MTNGCGLRGQLLITKHALADFDALFFELLYPRQQGFLLFFLVLAR